MQHYTRSTVSVSEWCKVCRSMTLHRVDDRRRGPCLDCLERQTREAALRREREKNPKSEQGRLF